MTDRELLASWELDILCAKNIGSVTLSKEFILAIDDFINRQKAEIERLQDYIENLRCINTDLSNNLLDEVKTARAEAVKEFAEIIVADYPQMEYYLNDLVKEFTGEEEND